MQANTIALAGCQKSAQIVIMTALKSAGFNVQYLPYDVRFHADNMPECLLIDLQGDDVFKARQLIDHPNFKSIPKLLMLDTRDLKARQFIASANINDILFKPYQIEELIARVQVLLKKQSSQPNAKASIKDEFAFAQTIQDLEARRFTGCLKLRGQTLEGELHFSHGHVCGARIGQKLQDIALTALWRLFPAQHELISNAPVPGWATPSLDINAEQVIGNVAHAGSEFRSIFPNIQGLNTIFKLNSPVYESAFNTLPRQVRRLVQTFDGDRSLNDIFSYINLDEFVLMQILKRLLDEHLITEIQQHDNSDRLSLVDWIRGVSDTEPPNGESQDRTVRMPPPLPAAPHEGKTTLRKMPPLPQPVVEEKTVRMPPPRPSMPAMPSKKASPKVTKALTDPDDPPVHATQSIIRYAFPSQVQQDNPVDLDNEDDDDKPFHAEPVVRQQFSRLVVEQKLKQSAIQPVIAETGIRRGIYYPDAVLDKEADADKTNASAVTSKPSSLTVVLDEMKAITLQSSLHSSIQEVENEITRIASANQILTEEASEGDKTSLKKEMPSKASSSAAPSPAAPKPASEKPAETRREHLEKMQKLYEKNHSAELSREEWREQTMERLNRENAEASAKFRRNLALLILLGLLLIALIIVLVSGTSSSPKQPTINPSKPGHLNYKPELARADQNIERPTDTLPPDVAQQLLPDPVIDTHIEAQAEQQPLDLEPMNMPEADTMPVIDAPEADTMPAIDAPAAAQNAPSQAPTAAKPASKPQPKQPKATSAITINKALQNTRTEMNVKNWTAAQKEITVALSLDPKHPIANVLAGQIQAKLGNFNKAIHYYKIAESANARKSVYWVQLSEYYRAAGNIKESDKALDKAIAIVGSASPEGRKLIMLKSNPTQQ